MSQNSITSRFTNISYEVQKRRFHAFRRETSGYPEVGVMVNQDLTIWRRLPDNPEDDFNFTQKLIRDVEEEARKV